MSDSTSNKQNQGDLAQQILDRIVTDEGFRQHLLNNPAETLVEAGYSSGDDVSGYRLLHQSAYGIPIVTTPQIDPPPEPFTTTGMDCGGGGGASTVLCDPNVPPEPAARKTKHTNPPHTP